MVVKIDTNEKCLYSKKKNEYYDVSNVYHSAFHSISLRFSKNCKVWATAEIEDFSSAFLAIVKNTTNATGLPVSFFVCVFLCFALYPKPLR